LTEIDSDEPLVLALGLSDPTLAERVVSMLAGVRELRLAAPGEPADLVLVAASPASAAGEDGVALTSR
jgi:hypothetical protein